MGYVFRPEDAQRYDEWFQSEAGRSALEVEKDLLFRLWSPSNAQQVLEVGCGTGLFLEWFAQLGHQVTGIDPSTSMLDIACRRLPGRVELDRGYAEDLPYEDGSFDTVALITVLEFADDPAGALREAIRVARGHVLLGVLNRYSVIACQRYLRHLWRTKPSVLDHARYFSVVELHRMVERSLGGHVPLHWRTCLSLPLGTLKYFRFLERSRFFQVHPFGHFIGMCVDLVYPLQTIMDPLFCKLSSGVRHAHSQASCWRFPNREKGVEHERGHVLQEYRE